MREGTRSGKHCCLLAARKSCSPVSSCTSPHLEAAFLLIVMANAAIRYDLRPDAVAAHAGLGYTVPAVKDNDHTLKLTFADPRRVISRSPGVTLQLTGAMCCLTDIDKAKPVAIYV